MTLDWRLPCAIKLKLLMQCTRMQSLDKLSKEGMNGCLRTSKRLSKVPWDLTHGQTRSIYIATLADSSRYTQNLLKQSYYGLSASKEPDCPPFKPIASTIIIVFQSRPFYPSRTVRTIVADCPKFTLFSYQRQIGFCPNIFLAGGLSAPRGPLDYEALENLSGIDPLVPARKEENRLL